MTGARNGLPVAMLLALASPALADAPCDTATFPAAPLHSILTARVKPGSHANFLTGQGTCPDDTQSCRLAAYLVPGDQVLTGPAHGSYICAYYNNGKNETAGWLPAARLRQDVSPSSSRGAWLGSWHYGDSTITIKQTGRDLSVSARAYWPSKSDPTGHEGHLDAQTRPAGDTLSLADPDDPQGCKLELALRAAYLIARDNSVCGGANVSLSGVYRK